MTTGIKFVGTEDIRILDGHDLNRAGVEGFHKTEFHKGQPVLVDQATADGIMNNPELYGKFELVEDTDGQLDFEGITDAQHGATEKAPADPEGKNLNPVDDSAESTGDAASTPTPKKSARPSTGA